MEVLTIKEKIQKSRQIAQKILNKIFIRDLFKVLDDPQYQEIISWSDDGQVFIINNEEKLDQIFSLFECCSTKTQFYQKLDDCEFAHVFLTDYKKDLMFEHITYTREKRPTECNKKLKKSNSVQQEPNESNPSNQREIDNDLAVLSRFERQLQSQIDFNTELLKSQMSLLEADLKYASSIREMIEAIQSHHKLFTNK